MEIGYSQLRGSSWELYFSLMERRWRWVRADLLVMGAYGHTHLREWMFGGVTRTVLYEADLPVLMSR